jgi:RNA polymerase-binding transcription factor DksA
MTTKTLPAAPLGSGAAGTRNIQGRTSHAWRTLLESRWGERLIAVITLSLAYHDTADQAAGSGAGGQEQAGRLGRLMRKTVAARRDLSETEEALARLSEGRFGRCEQCAAVIPADELARVPEARYCLLCSKSTPLHDSGRGGRGPAQAAGVYWPEVPDTGYRQED